MKDPRIVSLEREYQLATAEGDDAAAQRAINRVHDLREAAVERERAASRGELSICGDSPAEMIKQADLVFERALADGNPALARRALDAMTTFVKISPLVRPGRRQYAAIVY